MSNCKFNRTAGFQNKDGYFIKVTCSTCEAKFLLKDINISSQEIKLSDLIIEEGTESEYDSTKFSCPGEEYLQKLAIERNKKELAKLQVKKGDKVKVKGGLIGIIIKYSSNTDMVIQCPAEGGGTFGQNIIKEDIIEVIHE